MKKLDLLPMITVFIISIILMFYTIGFNKQLLLYIVLFPIICVILYMIIYFIKKK